MLFIDQFNCIKIKFVLSSYIVSRRELLGIYEKS
jgi:hypothetical protein